MKRSLPDEDNSKEDARKSRKRSHSPHGTPTSQFRSDLFNPTTQSEFRKAYSNARPYPHAVVSSLIDPILLRSVRDEIREHVAFTLKETDIYRIHQSGDLANLSNLDARSLRHLPSLVTLRDALYSYEFRNWISEVTDAGKLSGKKTDMAVNIYTPGSYLLCHDDVIGSRRVSYILYLTDPDDPWQDSWGGGLRLYPTEWRVNDEGKSVKIPLPDHSVNIPPAFGQLSFFAVRPGESYHDVEEVYHSESPAENKTRLRMAISGWYHIPQEGEEGFVGASEDQTVQKSSLAQLEGAADVFDEPTSDFDHFDEPRIVPASDAKRSEVDPGDESDADGDILSEQDLTFLLQYLTANFLTPEMTERFAQSFGENSFLQLEQCLNETFARSLKDYILGQEQDVIDQYESTGWRVACPPHKHRYLYLRKPPAESTPISKLLVDLLRSHAFKKWLALITSFRPQSLASQNVIARRFRRGEDYALASGYHSETPRLELTIGITPSEGWSEEESPENTMANGLRRGFRDTDKERINFGGEEVYMAGDDDDESIHSRSLPHVGKKADPAIYRSEQDDAEDGILFANPASWNTFSVVLRDKGTLRFVKYVSKAANGDRWDIKGEVQLSDDAFDEEEKENIQDLDEVSDSDSQRQSNSEVAEELPEGELQEYDINGTN